MAPINIMMLPKMIAMRRPSLSVINGTMGREAIEPSEYREDIKPRVVEFGLWKTIKPLIHLGAACSSTCSLTGLPRIDSLQAVHHG